MSVDHEAGFEEGEAAMRGIRPTEPGRTCIRPLGADPDPDACSKYCTDHPFTGPCDVCGELVEGLTYGGMEVIGAVHSGCFGYPLCSCAEPHQGECPEETRP